MSRQRKKIHEYEHKVCEIIHSEELSKKKIRKINKTLETCGTSSGKQNHNGNPRLREVRKGHKEYLKK